MNPKRVVAGGLRVNEKTPPHDIQIWNVGENPTDYGVHIWNDRSIASAMARYQERGNPLVIDVEHIGTKTAEGKPAPTGGYASLELRDGAPWLTFAWSDYGTEQIQSGERLFLSPEYDVDPDTGEILALYRVSLVADPGTHRARYLASAKGHEGMDPMTLAALRAALEADDPKAAIEALLKQLESVDGAPAAAAADEEPKPAVPASAEADTEEEPIAAAADEELKPAMIASAKSAKPSKDAALTTQATSAIRQIQNAQRDHLIATQGERLEPSIRRWASSQSLAVVDGLLKATPRKEEATSRATPTQGKRTAQPVSTQSSLEAEIFGGLGLRMQAYRAPFVREDGVFVLPVNKPSAVRAHVAATAAGKAG